MDLFYKQDDNTSSVIEGQLDYYDIKVSECCFYKVMDNHTRYDKINRQEIAQWALRTENPILYVTDKSTPSPDKLKQHYNNKSYFEFNL